jgi:hypothetical protein
MSHPPVFALADMTNLSNKTAHQWQFQQAPQTEQNCLIGNVQLKLNEG